MKLLVATDHQEFINKLAAIFEPSYSCEVAGNKLSAWEKIFNSHYDITLIDFNFMKSDSGSPEETYNKLRSERPGVRTIILCDDKSVRQTMSLLKLGADDYLSYPIDEVEARTVVDRIVQRERSYAELESLRDGFWRQEFADIVNTKCSAMREIFNMVKDVAPTNSTVFLNGETGVGKGILAKIIHNHSSRRQGNFIHVHCGAIPDNLLESELFGHEKGAFTGAIRRKLGKFELANKGTIFLDEVATLSAPAQIKLLQVLQDGIFQRVGGETDIKVDVRVITATNEDLQELVGKNVFRKDLFYRLNVFPIEIPPLRKRLEDLEHIVESIISRLNLHGSKRIQGITPETLMWLKKYPWPGNIRELENLVERAFILEKTNMLTNSSFPLDIFQATPDAAILPLNVELSLAEARNRNNENFERQYLTELLTQTHGKINTTADRAGISVRQLNNLMNKYGLDKRSFKSTTKPESEVKLVTH